MPRIRSASCSATSPRSSSTAPRSPKLLLKLLMKEREKVRARRHLSAIDDANNMEIGGEGDDNGGADGGEEEW